jgi:hypothetical protein
MPLDTPASLVLAASAECLNKIRTSALAHYTIFYELKKD